MDSVSSVSTFPEKVQTSQPSLTKRGLALQDKSENPSSETEKVATREIVTPPQTPPENAKLDLRV